MTKALMSLGRVKPRYGVYIISNLKNKLEFYLFDTERDEIVQFCDSFSEANELCRRKNEGRWYDEH